MGGSEERVDGSRYKETIICAKDSVMCQSFLCVCVCVCVCVLACGADVVFVCFSIMHI